MGYGSVLYWGHHQAMSVPLRGERVPGRPSCALDPAGWTDQRLQGCSSMTWGFSEPGIHRGSPTALCLGRDTTSLYMGMSGVRWAFV